MCYVVSLTWPLCTTYSQAGGRSDLRQGVSLTRRLRRYVLWVFGLRTGDVGLERSVWYVDIRPGGSVTRQRQLVSEVCALRVVCVSPWEWSSVQCGCCCPVLTGVAVASGADRVIEN